MLAALLATALVGVPARSRLDRTVHSHLPLLIEPGWLARARGARGGCRGLFTRDVPPAAGRGYGLFLVALLFLAGS
ncbi:MAG: hypothetical protein ACTHK2_13340 [Dokdonella sp.]|uniref:hypothetical protein n=1 Tax=Dokdonella sp. TaxID=2291710 RepID=UPI003F8223A3